MINSLDIPSPLFHSKNMVPSKKKSDNKFLHALIVGIVTCLLGGGTVLYSNSFYGFIYFFSGYEHTPAVVAYSIFNFTVLFILLRFLKTKHTLFIALFSSVMVFAPVDYYHTGEFLSELGLFLHILIYVLGTLAFYAIFTILSRRLPLALIVSILILIASWQAPDKISAVDNEYKADKGAEALTYSFQVYAPDRTIGRFSIKGCDTGNSGDTSHPAPFIDYYFTPPMGIVLSKAHKEFNKMYGEGTNYPLLFTTAKGRPVYGEDPTKYPPGSYFSEFNSIIGDTEILISNDSTTRLTQKEITMIIDSLHPISAEELKSNTICNLEYNDNGE